MRMSKRADPHGLRSKHRSALRLCLGTAYYSARRYLLWMSGKYRFASQRQKDRLPWRPYGPPHPSAPKAEGCGDAVSAQ